MIKNMPPATPKESPVFKKASGRQRVAEALFCTPGFAMVDFQKMDEEDWRLHARRSWEIAGLFISEIKQIKASH
jgi:hypothetical protein